MVSPITPTTMPATRPITQDGVSVVSNRVPWLVEVRSAMTHSGIEAPGEQPRREAADRQRGRRSEPGHSGDIEARQHEPPAFQQMRRQQQAADGGQPQTAPLDARPEQRQEGQEPLSQNDRESGPAPATVQSFQ